MLKHNAPTLVLVWSSWCWACAQLVSSALEALPNASALKLKLMDYDTDCRQLIKLGIRHLPVMLLFQGDKPMGLKMGSLTAQVLAKWLTAKLS